MIEQLLNRDVTILRRTEAADVDDFSDTPTAPVETETVGALDQLAANESGDIAETRWRLFLLPTIGIDSGDRVVIDATAYEVQGDPYPVEDKLTGLIHHLEVTLQRTGNVNGS